MTRISSRTRGAIVIGGGHNGLVCVAYMGKGGKRVLERSAVVGGVAVIGAFHSGFHRDDGGLHRSGRADCPHARRSRHA